MPTTPIVGAYFRPPAQLILDSIAVGTKMFVCAEPENAYDTNAIAVYIVSEDIPASAHPKLEEKLPGFGFDLDGFLAIEMWHVGYVPKEIAAELRRNGTVPTDEIKWGTFSLTAGGKPQITF